MPEMNTILPFQIIVDSEAYFEADLEADNKAYLPTDFLSKEEGGDPFAEHHLI